ncbi:NifU family protein [Thermaerobacter sp. PB12/4term]|uniref:NifU family protein n=1 Tax=Thermaerobacter sp. PB12/4term TaxID=2293838 RepID=UPI00193F1500|nr:NifU family protein [Thermaerobacter sp. PB12/4term]
MTIALPQQQTRREDSIGQGAAGHGSAEGDFESLAAAVDRALAAIRELPDEARQKAMELKEAIEAFHRHALRRLVRVLRATEAGKELLFRVVEDPAIYALFHLHGIVRPDLTARVAAALEEVRPYMRSHGGDVDLVKVEGDVVYVRLHGACAGCSLSARTLRDGVEEVVKARVPEVREIVVVGAEPVAGFVGPQSGVLEEKGWVEGPPVTNLAEGKPVRFRAGEHDVLLVRLGSRVMAFRNQCPHMGMPLEEGTVDGTVITCPWHGFRFDLTTGECLTAPHVQLEPFPVRVEGQRVWVRPH